MSAHNFKDLAGQRFNRWLVKTRAPNSKSGKARWLCICDCGNESILDSTSFTSGNSKSCGCYEIEMSRLRFSTHGACRRPEYRIWASLKDRCLNPSDRAYKHYGARGITICNEWRDSFAAFLRDMGHRPAGMTLDRIDNNLGYSPQNCRWTTWQNQQRNKRSNHLVTLNGETLCLSEWAERQGFNEGIILYRLSHGWTPEEAILTPVRPITRAPVGNSNRA